MREWTSADGKKVQARFIEKSGSNIRIKNSNGQEFTVPLSRFSRGDQLYADEASKRLFFQLPYPFDNDRHIGGVIIASLDGNVSIIPSTSGIGSGQKPTKRTAILGETLEQGCTIITGDSSEAHLLLTNGTLVRVGEKTNVSLAAFWQKKFKGSSQKISDLSKETSSSKVAFKLDDGDLVINVKKLNRGSSFMIESTLGVAGVRGTQFGFSTNSESTSLSVLEGKVGFLDTKKKAINIESEQVIKGSIIGSEKVVVLRNDEKIRLIETLDKSKRVTADYDLTTLSETVDGLAPKSNYMVKSALNLEMIWCRPGAFKMETHGPNDNAQYSVILRKGFYLGKFEVTQEEYEKVMGVNPSRFKGQKLPVENVSWHDAVAFCETLNEREDKPSGWKFKLPTEAQWEYACRAGSITKYAWGNDINSKMANYKESEINKTVEVGQYRSNQWGFYDMHGNLWEWCSDWYAPYPSKLTRDPQGPQEGRCKAIRGGSWINPKENITSGQRCDGVGPNTKNERLGFRLCLEVK